jgi:hypothetical protein
MVIVRWSILLSSDKGKQLGLTEPKTSVAVGFVQPMLGSWTNRKKLGYLQNENTLNGVFVVFSLEMVRFWGHFLCIFDCTKNFHYV